MTALSPPQQVMPDGVLDRLLTEHGELMDSAALRQLLKFNDQRALRRAIAKGAMPFPTFPMPGRHGPFARTRDVATWLKSLSFGP